MECLFYPVHMYINIHLVITYGKIWMLIEIWKISRNQMSQCWTYVIIIIIIVIIIITTIKRFEGNHPVVCYN